MKVSGLMYEMSVGIGGKTPEDELALTFHVWSQPMGQSSCPLTRAGLLWTLTVTAGNWVLPLWLGRPGGFYMMQLSWRLPPCLAGRKLSNPKPPLALPS